MQATRYLSRLSRSAREDLRYTLSICLYWPVTAAAVILQILVQILFHGIHSLLSPGRTLESAVEGVLELMIITYLSALVRDVANPDNVEAEVIPPASDERTPALFKYSAAAAFRLYRALPRDSGSR